VDYETITVPASDQPPSIDPDVPLRHGVDALFTLAGEDEHRGLTTLLLRAGLAWRCGCGITNLLWGPAGPDTCEYCGDGRPTTPARTVTLPTG
jgi:hypothetical protein